MFLWSISRAFGVEDIPQPRPQLSVACGEAQGRAQLRPTLPLQADQLIGLEGRGLTEMVTEPPGSGFFGYYLRSID